MQGANEQAKARLSSPANRKSSQRLFRVSKVRASVRRVCRVLCVLLGML